MARTLHQSGHGTSDDSALRREQARNELREGGPPRSRGTGVTKWTITLLVLSLVVVTVLAQNTRRTRINLLWGGVDAPLFAILVLVGLGFAALTEVASLLWRHRRRTRPSSGRHL